MWGTQHMFSWFCSSVGCSPSGHRRTSCRSCGLTAPQGSGRKRRESISSDSRCSLEERGPPLPASLAHTGASRQRGVGVIAAGTCLQGEGRGELVGLWNAHGMEGETGLADKQGPVIILLIFNGPSCLVELSCPGVRARLGLFLLGPCP